MALWLSWMQWARPYSQLFWVQIKGEEEEYTMDLWCKNCFSTYGRRQSELVQSSLEDVPAAAEEERYSGDQSRNVWYYFRSHQYQSVRKDIVDHIREAIKAEQNKDWSALEQERGLSVLVVSTLRRCVQGAMSNYAGKLEVLEERFSEER